MSTSSSPSRDQILLSFQDITQLNIEDCIHFLNQYNWQLEDIVHDFYKGKNFRHKGTSSVNEKIDEKKPQPTANPNLGNCYAKNDRKHEAGENDDHYYAQLLHIYGDADESARKRSSKSQEPHRQAQQQQQPPPQGNGKTEPIYHEKQKLLRCGIHSLNNLFQIPNLFTHVELDAIVREFDKRNVNNDYGKLWIGDYDLRILIEAINRFGHQVRQINFLKNDPLQSYPWDSYFGLLINLNGAHWFTIKNLNGIYYNLDSTFSKPKQIGQKDALINYLIRLIHKFDNIYIFAVFQSTNH